MATLISAYGGDGKLIGRCDARCYNATSKHCECICGGMNHGAGENQAIENTKDHAEDMIEKFQQETGRQIKQSYIDPVVSQSDLFRDN